MKRSYSFRSAALAFAILSTLSLVSCSQPEVQVETPPSAQVEQPIETSLPIATSGGVEVKEGEDIQEINSATQCDGIVGEDGTVSNTKNEDPADDCNQIEGYYYQPDYQDGAETGSGNVYYRESAGSDIVMIHDNYRPPYAPSYIFVGGYQRPVYLMQPVMVSRSGSPYLQGGRPIVSTVPISSTATPTVSAGSNGKAVYTPAKTTASFKTPITSTPISGGKVTPGAITSSKAVTSVNSSALGPKVSAKSAPSAPKIAAPSKTNVSAPKASSGSSGMGRAASVGRTSVSTGRGSSGGD